MDGEDTTRRRVLVAGGLSSVFGLSGCLRLSQAEPTGTATTAADGTATTTDESTTERQTTEEPTATESESTDDGEVTYPPGVSEDDVSESLVLAHREQTIGTPRTVETVYMGWQSQTARLDGNGKILVRTEDGTRTYVEGDTQYQRLELDGGTIYNYADTVEERFSTRTLTGIELLSGLVRGGNFEPVGTQTRNGETVFILEADAVENGTALERNRSISRYFRRSEFPLDGLSGSALADPSGFVPEIEVTLSGDGDSGPFAVRTTDVGSTSVSTPSWTSTAKSKAPQFSVSRSSDDDYMIVEQTSGQTLDGSAVPLQVDAFDARSSFNGDFEGTLRAGTTLYLYKTDETTDYGTRKLGVATGSRPSTAPPSSWSTDAGLHIGVRAMTLLEQYRV